MAGILSESSQIPLYGLEFGKSISSWPGPVKNNRVTCRVTRSSGQYFWLQSIRAWDLDKYFVCLIGFLRQISLVTVELISWWTDSWREQIFKRYNASTNCATLIYLNNESKHTAWALSKGIQVSTSKWPCMRIKLGPGLGAEVRGEEVGTNWYASTARHSGGNQRRRRELPKDQRWRQVRNIFKVLAAKRSKE